MVALAGTTAHELNQPLTSVMGYAELLKRKIREDDPSWRAIDIISPRGGTHGRDRTQDW